MTEMSREHLALLTVTLLTVTSLSLLLRHNLTFLPTKWPFATTALSLMLQPLLTPDS